MTESGIRLVRSLSILTVGAGRAHCAPEHSGAGREQEAQCPATVLRGPSLGLGVAGFRP